MSNYDWVTNEMFDLKLFELVKADPGIIYIPGIYEILSEHYNNQVLEELEDERNYQIMTSDHDYF